MKNAFFFLTACLWSVTLVAQTPIYLEFSPDCMHRLEYRYKGQATGSSIFSYSVRPNKEQLFIFDIGAEGNRVADKLSGTIFNCKNLRLDANLVEAVNAGNQKIYIARKVTGGWLISPAASAEMVQRNGTSYEFHAVNMHFTVDTNALDYGINLAHAGSGAYIFYNGRSYYQDGCHPVYAFHREPDEACRTKTDFDFIPGLGTISERTGMTAEEAVENEYRLVSVNGTPLDTYLHAVCHGQNIENQYVISEETDLAQPAITYQYTVPPPPPTRQPASIGQPDKEKAVATQQNPPLPVEHNNAKPVQKIGPAPLANCPEKPGEGYHIVQPGETLASISRAYGVKMGLVIAWNDIKDPDLIKPCQKIYLTLPPGGMKPVIDENTKKVAVATKKSKAKCTCDHHVHPATHSHTTNMASVSSKKNTTAAPKNAVAAAKTKAVVAKTPDPTPVQHSTPNTSSALVAKTVVRPPAAYKGIVHTVKTGETLYSVAKFYGFTAERFAKMNGLPANYALQPGMQLMTSDCTCDANGKPLEMENPASSAATTTTTKGWASNVQIFEEKQLQPQQYGSNSPSTTLLTTTASTTKTTNTPTVKTRGHYVQSGETLGDIARKYNVPAERIAQLNSIDMLETLIVGMRILIPD